MPARVGHALVVYRAATAAHPADWVKAGVHGFAESVLSLVPAGFAAYFRLFHPAYRGVGASREAVTWAEIARANGKLAHAGMQFGAITGSEQYEREGQAGVFDEPPRTGSIPPELVDRVAMALGRHTSTPGHCYFGLWEGLGALPPDLRSAPTFTLPNRTYHLFIGPEEAVREPREISAWFQSPNLWWPQDRSWCVATDVDLKSTYIGGDQSCLNDLASLPGLEGATIAPDMGVDWLSDTLNPPPARLSRSS